MKIAYVVTAGSYSDYGIQGVFSNKKAAQDFIDAAVAAKAEEDSDNGDYIGDCYWANDAQIEEWPLNEQQAAVVHERWRAAIMLDDGAQEHETRGGKTFGIPHNGTVQVAEKIPAHGGRGAVRSESCKSAKHAEKLAVEARQKYLREKSVSKV